MRIYVAGRYGARDGLKLEELEANVQRAIEHAKVIIKKGHNVFIPHLFHYVDTINGEKFLPEGKWIELSIDWLKVCDAIYMLPNWGESKGACEEHAVALVSNMLVFYDLKEVPND